MSRFLMLIFISFLAVLLARVAFAETCPTIEEIKNDQMHGWRVDKGDIYSPASKDEELLFKNQTNAFKEASWLPGLQKGGAGYCFYAPIPKTSHLFLGKFEVGANNHPDPGNMSWSPVGFFYLCRDSIEKCSFSPAS